MRRAARGRCHGCSRGELRGLDDAVAGEDLAHATGVVLRIRGFDADEEPVLRGALEPRRGEDRLMQARQPTRGEKGEESEVDREQGADLPRRGDEARPAVERTSADIDREVDDGVPVLDEVSPAGAGDRPREHGSGDDDAAACRRRGMLDLLERRRTVGVPAREARLAQLPRDGGRLLCAPELADQTIGCAHCRPPPEASLPRRWWMISRISNIETTGNRRMKAKKPNIAIPAEPMRIAQSQNVPPNQPHFEGM